MQVKTFHIGLSKEHLHSDETTINTFIADKEIINTFAELIKTEKVNYWTIIIVYSEQVIDKSGKHSYVSNTELNEKEQLIVDTLKKWRAETALTENVPPFVIAHDKELITIAKLNIETINDLKSIKGFADKKITKYGEQIVSILKTLKINE